MARADVLQLVQNLSLGQADAAMASRYYDEIVKDLARRAYLVSASLLASPVGVADYTLDESMVGLLHVFYGDDELMLADTAELGTVNPQWRDETGRPSVFILDRETARTFAVYPTPDASSKDFIFLLGSPLGRDYPEYAVGVIHTEVRENLPVWFELPVALFICTREFMRESKHRDAAFAEACQELGDALWQAATTGS